jgi:uncharacterized repeat protein (TIGR03803 family)
VTLHSFDGADGQSPDGAGLLQGTDGNFYGTTPAGGAHNTGTAFKMTPQAAFVTLYNFCAKSSCADGSNPYAGLVEATDGSLYGTTIGGGANASGTVFRLTSGGVLSTLHSFHSTDGDNPYGGLVQGTDGDLYGTTYDGGANRDGTVFSLGLGLQRFVKTLPTAGVVGKSVMILGTGLEGSTSVSFNGTPTTFKVVSSSLISTTVPSGATTGPVQVVTPTGTLTSNVHFQVQ